MTRAAIPGETLPTQPTAAPGGIAQSLRESPLGPHDVRSEAAAAVPLAELIELLDTDASQGLDPSEAERRAKLIGRNELREAAPPSAATQLLRQFGDVTVLALLGAAVIAALLAVFDGEGKTPLERFGDAAAIALIVALNAIIGFVQERKADRAIRALRRLGAPEAVVVRGGTLRRVPASELVPGDLVVLGEGARVPADMRLVEDTDLTVSEAALTGESLPVDKDTSFRASLHTPLAERRNMAHMGTHVLRGRATGLVVATGMLTELGRIAELLGSVAPAPTPLEIALQRFGRYVVVGSVLLGGLVFAIGAIRLEASLGFLLLTAVSLAVAAIPEGLPAITTIVLALGVERMAKKHALVRRLAAVETLGSADMICTDKTGTLTQNRMVVRRLWAGGCSGTPEDLLKTAARDPACAVAFREAIRCSGLAPAAELADDGTVRGDPTDRALLELHRSAAAELQVSPQAAVRVLPFDGDRKMESVVVRQQSGLTSYSHGASEVVLEHARFVLSAKGSVEPLDSGRRAEITEVIEAWAREGLRVLLLGRRDLNESQDVAKLSRDEAIALCERELLLIGLVGLADPPRPEVREALEKARRAGITTVMITGDHPRTAQAIAREIGLEADDEAILSGPEVDTLDEAALDRRLGSLRIVARATAAHKLRLVQALSRAGRVVAMTGDGVNDAPAIKAANIGIAMGQSGTDVTREAADMVLFDDNYATIVAAISEGRIIWSNIKRFIVFLFAVNTGLVLAVLVAALLGWPPIVTPTQILWINLITNGLPALALGMEPVHLDPMSGAPRSPQASVVERPELGWLLSYGALIGILGLGAFVLGGGTAAGVGPDELRYARSLTFSVLAFAPLFHALNARSRTESLFALGPLTNWRLLGAFVAAAVLQGFSLYVPFLEKVFGTVSLPPAELGLAIGASALVWLIGEAEKALRRAFRRSAGAALAP